eukprot:11186912-Alexandrium_andersonii.AAC.1
MHTPACGLPLNLPSNPSQMRCGMLSAIPPLYLDVWTAAEGPCFCRLVGGALDGSPATSYTNTHACPPTPGPAPLFVCSGR